MFCIALLALNGILHQDVKEFPAQEVAVASELIDKERVAWSKTLNFVSHIDHIEGCFAPHRIEGFSDMRKAVTREMQWCVSK